MNYSNRLSRLVSRSQIRSRVVAWGSLLGLALPLALGLGSGERAIGQEIDPGRRSPLTGGVRFVPPTDDEVGETQSGSSRQSDVCEGIFPLLPVALKNQGEYLTYPQLEGRSGEYFFPAQAFDDTLELFLYVSSAATTQPRSIAFGVESVEPNSLEPNKRMVSLSARPSIVRLEVDREAFEAGDNEEQYSWFFEYCNPSQGEVLESEFGGLYEIDASFADSGAGSSVEVLLERAERLARSGLWLETLVVLDDARRTATTETEQEQVEANWLSLFESVDWDFEQYPIAGVPVLTADELEAQIAAEDNGNVINNTSNRPSR